MNITNTNINNQTNQSFSSALSSFWFNLSSYTTSTVMITPQREVDKIIPVFEKDVDSRSYLSLRCKWHSCDHRQVVEKIPGKRKYLIIVASVD